MPGVSVGLTEIEDHLRTVRQRLNASTVQHAAYLSGSMIALATTLLVVLALRSGQSWFSAAAWLAIAASAAVLVAAALYTRREWLSLHQVARLADRQAALDDRIATALADRHVDARLSSLLIDQILAARPHWNEQALAPRRVPRSAYLLALSLAALAVVSFHLRPPARPKPLAVARAQAADAADLLFKPPPRDAAGSQSGTGAPAAHDQANDALSLSVPSASVRPGDQPGTQSAAAVGGSGGAQASADDSDHSAKGAAADTGLSGDLQNAIRRAFGAADDRQMASDRDAPAPRSPGQKTSDGRHAAAPNGPGADPNQIDRDAAPQEPQRGRPPLGGAKAGPPSGGAGAAAGAEGLFGAQPAAAPRRGGGTEPMALKLNAFAGVAPSQQAPQRDAPPVAGQVAAASGSGSPAPLADEQVPDAALQKADVAPEHQAIVQRIFTRDE